MLLKYGCNPHQTFASAEPFGDAGPFRVLNGVPSLMNVLDVLNAWQCVHELHLASGVAAAASFKHVSPAGAALAVPLSPDLARAYEVEGLELTPPALAYVRARNADPKSSYGDLIALSDEVDEVTASFIAGVVSDGIVAPRYTPDALEILRRKKKGGFLVIQADSDYEPPKRESREVFGIRLMQDRNDHRITLADLGNVVCGKLTDSAAQDCLLGLVTLKYTQSNSVGYALGGQMIGIGAGQQSRVDCTKLAGSKADLWHLRRHPRVAGLVFKPGIKLQERINWRVRFIEGDLSATEHDALCRALDEPYEPFTDAERQEWIGDLRGVSVVSDGLFPFRDNIDHAARHGVAFIAEPGGSLRDAEVQAACREHGMTLVHTGVRLFHH